MKMIINERVTTITATPNDLSSSNALADSFANMLRRVFNNVPDEEEEEEEEEEE